jgi:hypothetical protein
LSFLLSFYVVVLSVFVERQCFSDVFASCLFIVKLLSFCCRFVVVLLSFCCRFAVVLLSLSFCPRFLVDLLLSFVDPTFKLCTPTPPHYDAAAILVDNAAASESCHHAFALPS